MKLNFFLPALGIVCPLGNNKNTVFYNLILGNTDGVVSRDNLIPNTVVKLGVVSSQLPKIPARLNIYNTRCNRLLLAAYLQIQDEVKTAIEKYGKSRIAVIVGSGTSDIDEIQKGVEKYLTDNVFPESFTNNNFDIASQSQFLSKYIGLTGINYTVSTACTSSAKAFVSAQNLLNMGFCDAVIVAGSDSLCKLTVNGFYALESISEKNCNPFSKNRDGIVLGEGSAIFLMTKEKSDIALLGIGESSDAYHKTSPDPTGNGAFTAMENALIQADIKVEDIDYINLHGTGTILNDSMESIAVTSLFPNKPYCSSTKPLTGHTLGSASIIEIALCWLLLSELNCNNLLPPHIWDRMIDNSIEKLNLLKKDTSLKEISICMSNSFAFGGSNASLIIGKDIKKCMKE